MKPFDQFLLEEMEHEDNIDIAEDDNSAIDAFYPADDEDYCKNMLSCMIIDDEDNCIDNGDPDKEFDDLISSNDNEEEE